MARPYFSVLPLLAIMVGVGGGAVAADPTTRDALLDSITAVAVFQGEKYTGKSGEAHAGIFLGYGKDDKGRDGITLFDQSNEQDAGRHFFPFDRQGGRGYEADQFSVIK